MIYIGNDIVSISRIENKIKNRGKIFLNHIFTEEEQKYCNSKYEPKIHYAGKFAAKEAVKKAILSSRLSKETLPLVYIEILNDSTGYPMVNSKIFKGGSFKCQISISHTDKFAIAVAIIINEINSF